MRPLSGCRIGGGGVCGGGVVGGAGGGSDTNSIRFTKESKMPSALARVSCAHLLRALWSSSAGMLAHMASKSLTGLDSSPKMVPNVVTVERNQLIAGGVSGCIAKWWFDNAPLTIPSAAYLLMRIMRPRV